MTDATVPEIPPAGVLRNPTRNPAPTACQLPDPPDWFNPPEERSWRTRLGLHGTARFLRGRVLIGLCATVAVTVALTAFTMWLKPELTGEPTAWLFITLWGGVAMVTVCLAARQAPPGLFALTMLAQAALVVAQSSCQALVPGIFAMSTILIAALLATPVAVLLAACVIVASILVQPAGGSALTDMLSPMWMPQPALLGFAVGWALRHVALSHRRVENLAQRMCSLNELLHKHLQSADELAAARERTRIAQELHDRVGHGLTTTHLYLEVARRRASAESDDVAQALERATESNRDALRELRSCVTLLREPDSDRSLS
ncbi:MAG: histidine kinase, partial [Myxococcota bacterium]